MAKDYIPANDEQFESWLQNFASGLTIHASELDVDMAEITAVAAARANLDNAIADSVNKRAASKSATLLKAATRDSAAELVRGLVRRIVASPAMTDAIRAELGLHVPDSTLTPSTSTVGPEIPKIYLEALPGRVLVHFGTFPGNKRKNTKPAWAVGCTVYRRKAGESSFTMVGFRAKSPYTDMIDGPGADYTYIVRYQGKESTDIGVNSSESTVAANGLLAA